MEGAMDLDRKMCKCKEEEALVKPARSFRYEDYRTRRVFLRSYPLQWASPADEKQVQGDAAIAAAAASEVGGDGGCRRWKQLVAAAVAEWAEEQMLVLRRVKKRLALYLLGCHYGRPALPCKSGTAAAMLKSS